jgi:hypothetical protein
MAGPSDNHTPNPSFCDAICVKGIRPSPMDGGSIDEGGSVVAPRVVDGDEEADGRLSDGMGKFDPRRLPAKVPWGSEVTTAPDRDAWALAVQAVLDEEGLDCNGNLTTPKAGKSNAKLHDAQIKISPANFMFCSSGSDCFADDGELDGTDFAAKVQRQRPVSP